MTFARKSLVRAAAPVLFLPVLATLARAQVFQYSLNDNNQSGFGYAVNRVGDVDKDGYEDFIVGAPYHDNDRGEAIVFSGATGAELTRLKGSKQFTNFGFSVEGRLDLDGDGYQDILVGAPYELGDAGTVLAYSPHLSMKLYKLTGPNGAGFGSSIRSLEADIDGDGVDDFIVGAPGIFAAFTPTAYVYSGATGAILFTKTGQSGSNFGAAVSRGGDLDGDQICDFIVGSPQYTDSSLGVIGRVSAFSGADGKKLWSFDGLNAGSSFGSAIAEPGDLDGDGVADIVVGAPYDLDSHGVMTGSAIVISGATGTFLHEFTGDAADDRFGFDVRGVAGDIDGDGVRDFIVGAPGSFTAPGYARTFSGSSGAVLHTYVEHDVDPSGIYAMYGYSVAGGDFNGDGKTDVLIGNYHYNGEVGLIEIFDTAVASWQNYGSGWPGTLGVPSFTASNDPVIGQQISLTIANSAGAPTPGLLLVGVSPDKIPTGKGGTLFLDPVLFLTLSLPTSSLSLTDNVANDPALAGVHAYLQALELDAGASNGLSFTEGLDLFFGFN